MALKEKWQNLSDRERLSVSVVGILLAIMVVYYGIINPLASAVDSVKQQVNVQQTLAAWMAPRVAALTQLKISAPTQVILPANLLATVDTQLKQSAMAGAVTQISQTNVNQVQVTLKEVPFDELMTWLVQQWQQSQIQVSDFSAEKTDKPGMVTVTMILGTT